MPKKYCDFFIDCKTCGACIIPYEEHLNTPLKTFSNLFKKIHKNNTCEHKYLIRVKIRHTK